MESPKAPAARPPLEYLSLKTQLKDILRAVELVDGQLAQVEDTYEVYNARTQILGLMARLDAIVADMVD